MFALVRKKVSWLPPSFKEWFESTWAPQSVPIPSVTVIETKKNYEIVINSPGLNAHHVRIAIDPEKHFVLTIEKKIKSWEEKENVCTVCREIFQSYFQQKIYLPECTDKKEMAAKMENGVLTVQIPKAEPLIHRNPEKHINNQYI